MFDMYMINEINAKVNTDKRYVHLEHTYKRNVLIRSWRRKAPTASSAELDDKYRPTVMCSCVAITQRTVA